MRDKGFYAVVAAVVAAILLVGVFTLPSYFSEDSHLSCRVTGTDRTKDSEGNSDARVYTEDCGTFQVADTLVKGKFNSADTFGSIQEGKTYDFTTIGWRVGFLSMFPNIIEAEESQ